MKPKKKTKNAPAKVPERFAPIVDAVVEMVFARLEEAAARSKRPAKGKGRPSTGPRNDGLAGAVADLLLTSLTHQPEVKKKRKKVVVKRKREDRR